jgi:hypothetical protein
LATATIIDDNKSIDIMPDVYNGRQNPRQKRIRREQQQRQGGQMNKENNDHLNDRQAQNDWELQFNGSGFVSNNINTNLATIDTRAATLTVPIRNGRRSRKRKKVIVPTQPSSLHVHLAQTPLNKVTSNNRPPAVTNSNNQKKRSSDHASHPKEANPDDNRKS